MDKRLTTNANLKVDQDKPTPDSQQDDQGQTQDSQQPNKIEGYALMFNQPSKDLGGFVEVIDPKALDGVDLSNVIMLDQHDYSKPLASVKAGTLQLDVDDKGLHFTATIDPNVSYANDTLNNVKNGNINSMSFRFDTDDGSDSWTRDDNGQITRTVNKIKDLLEVSTVTIPSYNAGNVDVDKTSIRSYNQFIESEEQDKMQKTLLNPAENPEQPSMAFENYIRSRGETRDGLTTKGAEAVIPEEVVNPVLELKNSKYNLANYATVKTVGTGSGHYPIATRYNTATLATKEELAEIGDVDANMFENVKFETKTRAGKIALSNEIVDDAEVDIVAEVKNQLQKLVDNTDNAEIIKVLQGDTFQKKAVANVDDLKKVFNVDLDPALQGTSTWLVNQSAFQVLDTLKDNEGRYLLQPDVTAPSGFSLLGQPVVKISNKFLPDNSDGTHPMILGDIAEAVAVFRRNQVTAQWDKFDMYSQGLSVVVRNDYQPISADAAFNLSLADSAKGTTAK
ncbi:MAG: phage major capsid protein [Limosilactobacillus oris]|jgi:HK97 family phage major capsid protein|uniref:phage major capsid protein n=1 Tax=Limosilactobacillus oris TaxID=1632 RepID=UPI002430688D|nr:phage major capsid protein [Limosilactobacillus oris]MCH3911278.1 phage major capsid protein [Limosilactobacillus oris]MCH3938528.1 phage major capsid protein [Limosilactobacillus oris]MCI1980275.1 phage major capsid protein [Limosilactobacillus oris]MCI2042632.1 phage major capsid protein [Limosilactobacillus oris]